MEALEELKALGTAALLGQLRAAAPRSALGKPQVAAVAGDELRRRFVLGKLTGSVATGDLQLEDETGAMALSLVVSEDGGAGAGVAPRGNDVAVALDERCELLAEAVDVHECLAATPSQDAIVFALKVPVENISAVESVDSDGDTEPMQDADADMSELCVLVTHVCSVTRLNRRWSGVERPQYRHMHGIAFPFPQDSKASGFIEHAHCVELLVTEECKEAWSVSKCGLYRVQAARIRSGCARSGGLESPPTTESSVVEAVRDVWKQRTSSDSNAGCVHDVVEELERKLVDSPAKTARRRLRLYRVDHRGSFTSIAFQTSNAAESVNASTGVCEHREKPEQVSHSLVLDADSVDLFSPNEGRVLDALPLYYLQALVAVIRRIQTKSSFHVSELLAHRREPDKSSHSEGTSVSDGKVHQPHLMSVTGLICERRYYWRDNLQGIAAGVGTKRRFDTLEPPTDPNSSFGSQRRLVCVIRLRGLTSLDTVDIHIDTPKFGFRSSLQPGSVVEFCKLQGFVARTTYRVFLNWGALTATRLLSTPKSSFPSDAELYGSMPTSFLNDLYSTGSRASAVIDTRLHRYVARVVYINYVIVKRKCNKCHRSLLHDRRRGWTHAPQSNTASKPSLLCGWVQLQHSAAALSAHSYVHTNLRCIIDDGSAQAELFLENDVAWDLLRCSPTQRARLKDVRVSELRFFAGQSAANSSNGYFAAASPSEDEAYYQNQLRDVVLKAVADTRQVSVFARQFFSKSRNPAGIDTSTSILTFGRDILVTTRTTPTATLDGRRVDDLHVKSELRRLLGRLRAMTTTNPPPH